MDTLTYGRKQPEAGDESEGLSGWFQAISDNIALDDAHTHDGNSSPRLDSRAVDSYTTTTGTSWNSTSNGLYRILMTMPSGKDFDKYVVICKTSAGQQVFLDIVKVSSSTYYVYTNDNTQNYTVCYLS